MKTVLIIRVQAANFRFSSLSVVVERTLSHLSLTIYFFIYISCIPPFLESSVAVRYPALFAIIHMLRPLSNKIQFTACIFKSRISVLNYFYTCIVSVRFFLALAN